MSDRYYIKYGGEKRGPYDKSFIKALILAGTVAPDVSVKKTGTSSNWQPFASAPPPIKNTPSPNGKTKDEGIHINEKHLLVAVSVVAVICFAVYASNVARNNKQEALESFIRDTNVQINHLIEEDKHKQALEKVQSLPADELSLAAGTLAKSLMKSSEVDDIGLAIELFKLAGDYGENLDIAKTKLEGAKAFARAEEESGKVLPNHYLAREYYKKAIGHGYQVAETQYKIGQSYVVEERSEQEVRQGYEYLAKAAESGHEDAIIMTSLMDARGKGVPQNVGIAIKRLEDIALGNGEAAYALADILYSNDQKVRSLTWALIGKALENEDAVALTKKIAKDSSQSEIDEAASDASKILRQHNLDNKLVILMPFPGKESSGNNEGSIFTLSGNPPSLDDFESSKLKVDSGSKTNFTTGGAQLTSATGETYWVSEHHYQRLVAKQLELSVLSSELDGLGSQIDSRRANLNRYDGDAVDSYNALVNRYEHLRATYNTKVDAFNSELERVGRLRR